VIQSRGHQPTPSFLFMHIPCSNQKKKIKKFQPAWGKPESLKKKKKKKLGNY
jgi:hypothetical protein